MAVASCRPRRIFHAVTPVGIVTVWKSLRTDAAIYDIHVDDALTRSPLQRQQIVRADRDAILIHDIHALDGTHTFRFDEAVAGRSRTAA